MGQAEPNTCAFPFCSRIAQKNGLCIHHKIYENEFPVEVIKLEKSRIKQRSTKREKQQVEYRKIVKAMIAANPNCSIKSPVCTGKAQGLNHKQKRSPKNLLEIANLERACNACNLYVENNPEWAKERGHQVSRFK